MSRARLAPVVWGCSGMRANVPPGAARQVLVPAFDPAISHNPSRERSVVGSLKERADPLAGNDKLGRLAPWSTQLAWRVLETKGSLTRSLQMGFIRHAEEFRTATNKAYVLSAHMDLMSAWAAPWGNLHMDKYGSGLVRRYLTYGERNKLRVLPLRSPRFR
jgi:hypothetical protein